MPSSRPRPETDLAAARATLGVAPGAPWATIRAAYRDAIRTAHPDLAGGSTPRAAVVNAAYGALVAARRAGTLDEPAARTPPPPTAAAASVPVGHGVLASDDTLHLPLPGEEAFLVVLEACHRVGDVTYVDRQCAIVEALLQIAGEGTCSLVVTFQGRAHGTDAFCTLEAIEHVGSPPIAPVVAELGEVVAEVLHAWRAPSDR